MPYFGQDILESAAVKGPLTEPAYADALARSRDVSRRSIDETLQSHSLGRILCSHDWSGMANRLGARGTGRPSRDASSACRPSGGTHTLRCRVDSSGTFRVGVSFFGPAWSEPRLIALAYAYEQATMNRRPPRMLETAAIGSASPESS